MIGLTGEVSVDVRAAGRRAREIVTSPSRPGTLDGYTELLETLSRELLPGWCDEWLMIERERWDQARLHALEALARRLLTARLHLPALEVALAAAAIEPMREGAHRTIVEIHIAEGNSASAIKQYQRYRSMLHRELGIAPSQEMQRLIRSIVAG
jgi:two-component SAPR family response regulator